MKASQGFIIFSVGIVLAIVGASKVPLDGSEWPDTVPVFLAGSLLAAIGLFLWRRTTAAEAREQAASSESANDPYALLSGLIEPLDALKADLDTLDTEALSQRIDHLLNDFVLPFAEVRQVLVNRLGMEKGAEVLVIVAFGERLLNRVWTAAADGHLPEARACFPEAHEAFTEAQALIANVASA
jgi:hypothetical protein